MLNTLKLSIIATALLSNLAFAKEKSEVLWVCKAVGYNANYEPQSVDGPAKSDKNVAKAEALKLCRGKQCHIERCDSYSAN